MAAAAARRVPLERPPSASDNAKVKRQQELMRIQFGANLRRLRTEAGLSQRALAMRADVSINYISQSEQGRRGVTIDFLVRVAYHLGISPLDLLSE
jgi:ribosome-binding protein aMBF1 (putative translation factor)